MTERHRGFTAWAARIWLAFSIRKTGVLAMFRHSLLFFFWSPHKAYLILMRTIAFSDALSFWTHPQAQFIFGRGLHCNLSARAVCESGTPPILGRSQICTLNIPHGAKRTDNICLSWQRQGCFSDQVVCDHVVTRCTFGIRTPKRGKPTWPNDFYERFPITRVGPYGFRKIL